ncbi:hypothetical protein [Streptomyces sp. NPDC102437]|uniref:hypothetical protein n=1 Tax=Streptomyces sp. NPDC102437 TaxID=3366175 RepID=UPI0038245579
MSATAELPRPGQRGEPGEGIGVRRDPLLGHGDTAQRYGRGTADDRDEGASVTYDAQRRDPDHGGVPGGGVHTARDQREA